jgi:hypothetical protein
VHNPVNFLYLEATVLLLDPIKAFVKTITFDNGKEFTLHEKIADAYITRHLPFYQPEYAGRLFHDGG